MIIGCVKEIKNNEFREGMTPMNVNDYVKAGHKVLIEASAGVGSGFSDLEYKNAGAQIIDSAKKVWDTLTPEQRNAVSSAAVESSGFMKKLWAEVEAQALEKLKKEGVQVLEKNQIAMSGIEAFAIKLYSKYVTNKEDLDAVLSIIMYAQH